MLLSSGWGSVVMMSIMPFWITMGLSLVLFSLINMNLYGVILGLIFLSVWLVWLCEDLNNKSVWDVGDWGLGVFSSGFLLFIFTECMFLISALMSMLYSLGVEGYSLLLLSNSSQDCMGVPLLISIILLSSGVSVTAYHNMFHTSMMKFFNVMMMMLTIMLGIVFLMVQYEEWSDSSMMWGDGFYGSIFYFITGFHGLHVMVGLFLLSLLMLGLMLGLGMNFSGVYYECVVWYWHFVDVVWLFVFLIVYWYSM